jgi:membrane-associated phospholipid phosphatase
VNRVPTADGGSKSALRTRVESSCGHRPATGARRADEEGWLVQLALGLGAVAIVALEGLLVAHSHVAGTLDGWLDDVVPGSRAAAYVDVTWLRYPWVVIVGAVVFAALAVPRDLPRAVACLVGPPLAVLVGEELIKPLVDRTLGGTLTYPSGSTTGAAALAAAAILVAPGRWKRVAAVAGTAYAIWMTTAVVALRWHFPTDALAGVLLGAGFVVACDAAAHLLTGRLHLTRRGGPRRG